MRLFFLLWLCVKPEQTVEQNETNNNYLRFNI